MTTTTGEDIQAAKIGVEVIIVHVTKHADFRGRIIKLDKGCTICQNYFSDELAKT
jgi:hypothetical protein